MVGLALRVAYLTVNVFIFLCSARIIMSWFSFPPSFRIAPLERAVAALTDWYFRLFSRLRAFRRGAFDFTPTFALLCLVLLSTILAMLAQSGRLAFGLLAGVILTALWSAFAFFLVILIILFVVRLAAFGLKLNTFGPFFRAVEALSDPVLFRVKRIAFGKRIVKYWAGLAVAIAALSGVWLAGTALTGYASALLTGLPF
jgi:YggT family protein